MESLESIIQYYQSTGRTIPEDLIKSEGKSRHFNVLRRRNCLYTLPFRRRDYYKICLSAGDAVLLTDTREVLIDRPALFFSAPDMKFGYKVTRENQDGYVCIFNEQYLSPDLKREFKKAQGFLTDTVYPFIFLTDEEYEILSAYFKAMERERCGGFYYKREIIQSLIRLVIYTAIRIHDARAHKVTEHDRTDRLLSNFLRLLNNQFPVDSPESSLVYKTPADFANALHVHVNHLNHSLQKLVGKSTRQIIYERVTAEAMDLLKHSDWNITEISNGLGFEYTQHFSQFFKKQTGKTPMEYKRSG
ncbi:hypothetical protein A8C56_14635 [Niabella ginsenosidivorans]|uniref:HTH araC/xylS-type domain-containing protein n=1 Tax=Niabella ginsenosidivorans TaxID=1176587 RepID=A0A1A9I5S9_9BACT|nr:helix-turn-helix transcriptional regulator [Niabella ginsenosidivorans]ANH82041.1 hypothetical protein A8C56_14635 [Niabella ginsenosidivorans]